MSPHSIPARHRPEAHSARRLPDAQMARTSCTTHAARRRRSARCVAELVVHDDPGTARSMPAALTIDLRRRRRRPVASPGAGCVDDGCRAATVSPNRPGRQSRRWRVGAMKRCRKLRCAPAGPRAVSSRRCFPMAIREPAGNAGTYPAVRSMSLDAVRPGRYLVLAVRWP